MPSSLHLHPKKSALLIMDFQVVLLENYLSQTNATAVLEHTAKLIASARTAGMMVIYVTVAFRPGHPEVSPRNKLFSLLKESGLFARGSEGTAIHSAVSPKDDEPIVIKHRVSAFAGTDLETLLKANGVETLVLAGITTSGVVLSTVRQGFDLDYHLVVVRDGCADPDSDVHGVLLDKVIAQHATVASAAEIAKALHGEA
jgi:nicotinamidase-related amidase